MNKIKLYILFLPLSFILWGCCEDCDSNLYETSATIFLINETSTVVKSDAFFGYVIQPGETLIHNESFTREYSKKPTVNTYEPFPTKYLFYYEDESKCEIGLTDIMNYINRKEVKPLTFEFTFKFTENKKASAVPCN